MASTTDNQSKPIPEPIVTLSKVFIRPLHLSDAPHNALMANDPDIAKGMRNTFPYPYALAHAESFITNAGLVATKPSTLTDPATDVLTNYAICRRSDGAYIGGMGLKPGSDVEQRTMEIGYWIGRDHWGHGYMTEAVAGFATWAFRTFPETLRLEGSTFEGNVASGRVLVKAGFRPEGVRRKAVWKNGKSLDVSYFGMLREECPGLEEGS